MKREDLKAKGLSDEQIEFIMGENGKDVQAEQDKAAAAVATAKKFEGVDVDALNAQIAKLTKEKEEYIFHGKVKDAITAAGGRSVKAVSALLDTAALQKVTEGQDEAIKKAVEEVKTANAWAFASAPDTEPTVHVSTGDEHGSGGGVSEVSEVEKLFLAQNPGLKV